MSVLVPLADLAVASTSSGTGWRRLVFGSVTEKVVRHAPVPVLVVRAGSHGEDVKGTST